MTNDNQPKRPDGLARHDPAPRRVRLHRAEGCRRLVLPLLCRLAHERRMEADEPPPVPSTRPRPWLN